MSKKSDKKPVFPSEYRLDFKQKIFAIAKSQLWLLVVFLIGMLCIIETVHTRAHQKMEIDVHAYCKQNAGYQESLQFEEDDW